MTTPSQDWLQAELARRPVFLSSEIVGYDDDPNAGGAPAVLGRAPVGTYYQRDSPNTFYRKATTGLWMPLAPGERYLAPNNEAPAAYHIAVHPDDGDDSAPGTEEDPIKTIRECLRRQSAFGEFASIHLMEGEHRLPDWQTIFGTVTPPGAPGTVGVPTRSVFGHDEHALLVYGDLTVVATFTIGSSIGGATGFTVTAFPDPGWSVDQFKGKWFRFDSTLTGFAPIIKNTSDTLSLVISTITTLPGAGGGTGAGGAGEIYDCSTIIRQPTLNSNFFVNRFYIRGLTNFHFLSFDGSGQATQGFSGPTGLGYTSSTFSTCAFRNWTGRGLEPGGGATVNRSVFQSCSDGAFGGADNVLWGNCFVESCPRIARVRAGNSIFMSANSMIAARSISEHLLGGIGHALIQDESTRQYLDTVRDYAFLSRGSHFNKINAAFNGVPGFRSPTRNVIRFEDGGAGGANTKTTGGTADLLNTAAQNLTPSGAYIHMSGIDVSLAEYTAAGFEVTDMFSCVRR